MSTFEFQARPKDGRIEIPEEYKDKIVGTVRVTITPEEQAKGSIDMVERLLERPLSVKDFSPLTREEAHERH